MAYTGVTWKDYPSITTPINAANLAIMDKGISDAHQLVATAQGDANTNAEDIVALETVALPLKIDKANILATEADILLLETEDLGFVPDAQVLKALINSLKWKPVGTANGTTPINLPSVFEEIEIIVNGFLITGVYGRKVFHISKLGLSDTNKRYEVSYTHPSGGGSDFCGIVASKTSVKLNEYFYVTTNTTASSSIEVNYR